MANAIIDTIKAKNEAGATVTVYPRTVTSAVKNNDGKTVDTILAELEGDITTSVSTSKKYADEVVATEKSERQTEIAVERARIDAFTALPEGSTTGDAALEDIKIKADGTTADTAGNAVREQINTLDTKIDEVNSQLSNEIVDVQNVLGIKENSIIDNLQYGQSMFNSSMRWFINYLFPKNSYIKELDFYGRSESGSVDIEFWERVGDELTLGKSITVELNEGINKVQVDYSADYNYMIAINTDTFGMSVSSSTAILGLVATSDKTSTVLDMSSFTSYPALDICGRIEYLSYNPKRNVGNNIVTVGENCEYEEIQNALDAITDDSEENPYTLIVYPKATPYKRFSVIRKLSEAYPSTMSRVRSISIIGINKYKVIVEDDSGEYLNSPAEILCNGLIKNIQFISTHNTPQATPSKGGYACHIDTRTPGGIGCKTVFENCDFTSHQAPAVGIGLHSNIELIFKNCYFENCGDTSYKPNASYENIAHYGSVFCHTDTGANVPNQNITFDTCKGITKNGAGLWLSTVGSYNGGMTVKAYNNMFYSEIGNKVNKSEGIDLDMTSYGNNSDLLNA